MGSKTWVCVFTDRMFDFAYCSKNHEMRERPKNNANGKDDNEAPKGGHDPNAPKKNPSNGVGARRDN